jgi:hypothetical protein
VSLSILFFALHLNAQTTAVASVDGIIRDSTGNVIVNAQVTMTETDKGLVRTTVTNTEGGYSLPNLPVGPLCVAKLASASGIRDFRAAAAVRREETSVPRYGLSIRSVVLFAGVRSRLSFIGGSV